MTERAFDRIAEAFLADGPNVLPDRVLDAALDEVHLTRQRRWLVRAPWRFPLMNTYAKVALAAVVVIAVGAVGLAMFRPGGSSGVGGDPVVSPSPSPSAQPSLGASPSASDPPALTGQYTSAMHGISIAYPDGWATRPATTPWTSGVIDYSTDSSDVLFDDAISAHLWLAIGSQPLGGRTPEQWAAEMWSLYGCPSNEPVTIDGAPGTICTENSWATVTADDRGYLVVLYTSDDDVPPLADTYDRAWFEQVLTTVELAPEDAVDAPPPAP